MGREICAEGLSKEFTTIITLETAHNCMELRGNKSKETKKSITCVRLSTERKDPSKMRKII